METRPGAVLARLRADEPGVSLVVLGALHGNETSGARALERVLPVLREQGLERGDLVALIGNPSALNLTQRYVDRDLNRRRLPDLPDLVHEERHGRV